jgi:hypothetical protein
MTFFARAVVTGFALAMGAALFKKVSKQLGFEDEPKAAADKDQEAINRGDAATDPGLHALS